jgi:hypothetical protein
VDVTCNILHKRDGLQSNIYADYFWEIALNFGLYEFFHDGLERNIGESRGEVNSTEAYITSNETSR